MITCMAHLQGVPCIPSYIYQGASRHHQILAFAVKIEGHLTVLICGLEVRTEQGWQGRQGLARFDKDGKGWQGR
jgi:hypothetical protein